MPKGERAWNSQLLGAFYPELIMVICYRTKQTGNLGDEVDIQWAVNISSVKGTWNSAMVWI